MYKFARTQLYKMCPSILDTHLQATISALNWHESNFDTHGWAFTEHERREHARIIKDLEKEFDFLAGLLAKK